MKMQKTLRSYSCQRGVVLVISLIILLVLTLLSVNMIQQNRLEFMMAGNAQTQTEVFSSAESLLKLAENSIDTWHQNYSLVCLNPLRNDDLMKVSYQCYNPSTNSYDVPQILDNLNLIEPPQKLYHCLTSLDLQDSRFSSLKVVDQELADLQIIDENPDTNEWEITNSLGLDNQSIDVAAGTKVSITSVSCLKEDDNNEEVCKNESQNGVLDYAYGCSNLSLCASLIYTIKATSISSASSSARSVESKYAVRCDKFNFNL